MTGRLPRYGQAFLLPNGSIAPVWYDYLRTLDSSSLTAEIERQVQANAAAIKALQEAGFGDYLPASAFVLGINSVETFGELKDGTRVMLRGDVALPDPTTYYGANSDQDRGFHPISDAIEAAAGELTKVVDEDGVTTFGLSDVPDQGGGTLQRIQRDAKGRVSGTSEATTDDLPEGGNLYFTDERARTAAVTDEIDPLATDTAPSGRAVAEALDGIDLSGYAELSADNVFTGAENRFDGTVWLTANIFVEDLSDIAGGPLSSIRTPEKSVPIMVSSGALTEAGASALTLGGGVGVQINTQDAGGFNVQSVAGPMAFQASGLCLFNSATDDVTFNGVSVRPLSDDSSLLGSPSYRWSEVFAVNGAINTSDARHKTDPRDMTSEEIACAADIARLPCVFKWLSAIEDKGEEARLHIGPTVQAVIACMESHGLDPMRYGFVCYDEWEAQEEKAVRRLSPEGRFVDEVLQEALPAGDVYSLRPTELSHFVIRGLAHRQDELDRRLATLESENADPE